MELVRRARRAVSSLPAEDETIRVALGPVYSPLQSLIVENAGPGFASGWLAWQAGVHWPRFLETAIWPTGPAAETPEAVAERTRRLERGRVRYLLRQAGPWPRPGERLPPPWRPLRRVDPFEIWEQPRVGAFAVHHAASRHAATRPDADPGTVLEWQRLAPERLRIALPEAAPAGRVFVSQSFHPWWRARVDGVAAPIRRVEESFLGVAVGAGARTLELEFRPPLSVVAAEVVSLGGWGVVVLWLGVCGLRRPGRAHARDGHAPEAPTRSPAAPRFD